MDLWLGINSPGGLSLALRGERAYRATATQAPQAQSHSLGRYAAYIHLAVHTARGGGGGDGAVKAVVCADRENKFSEHDREFRGCLGWANGGRPM